MLVSIQKIKGEFSYTPSILHGPEIPTLLSFQISDFYQHHRNQVCNVKRQ